MMQHGVEYASMQCAITLTSAEVEHALPSQRRRGGLRLVLAVIRPVSSLLTRTGVILPLLASKRANPEAIGHC